MKKTSGREGKNQWMNNRFNVISLFVLGAIAILLFSVFVFNGDADDTCKKSLVVTVREQSDSTGNLQLYVSDEKGNRFIPRIYKKDVVISSGAKLRICFQSIDTMPDKTLSVLIIDAVPVP
jgi:hypothetical protein